MVNVIRNYAHILLYLEAKENPQKLWRWRKSTHLNIYSSLVDKKYHLRFLTDILK